jgi:hypothetical protein
MSPYKITVNTGETPLTNKLHGTTAEKIQVLLRCDAV